MSGYDVAPRTLWSHLYRFDGGSTRASSAPYRYVWPAERELMAQLAGLELRHRWADRTTAPFTRDSTGHVSVWQRP